MQDSSSNSESLISSRFDSSRVLRRAKSSDGSIFFSSESFKNDYPFISIQHLNEIASLSKITGMQSEEIIKMLGICYSNNLFLIIRPTNPATKTIARELGSAQGKMMDIKAKSSIYSCIAGLIPVDQRLSKITELSSAIKSTNDLEKVLDASQEKVKKIFDEADKFLLEKVLNDEDSIITKVNKTVFYEGNEYPVLFFLKDNKVFLQDNNQPFFGIEIEGKIYQYQDNKIYDAPSEIIDLQKKTVEVVAYVRLELKTHQLKDPANPNNPLDYKIEYKTVIPDYDIYTYGRRLDFVNSQISCYSYLQNIEIKKIEEEFREDLDKLFTDHDKFIFIQSKLKDVDITSKIDADKIAQYEFDQLIEDREFARFYNMGEVYKKERSLVTVFKGEVDKMINHATEVTNRNPEKILGDFILLGFNPEFEFSNKITSLEEYQRLDCDIAIKDFNRGQSDIAVVSEKSQFNYKIIDIGEDGLLRSSKEITDKLQSAMESGYFIEIGSRWGFEMDRESGLITFNQSKRKDWETLFNN
jgi:hypothetical protein